MLQRITGEISIGGEPGFFQNASTMGADGLDADVHSFGNIRQALACGDELEYLKFFVR